MSSPLWVIMAPADHKKAAGGRPHSYLLVECDSGRVAAVPLANVESPEGLELGEGIAVAAEGVDSAVREPCDEGHRGMAVVPPSSAVQTDCRKKSWDLPLIADMAADDCNRARRLTARQAQILRALKRGASNKEIARNLGILESTVKVHLKSIYRQLNVRNRTQAAIVSAQYDAADS